MIQAIIADDEPAVSIIIKHIIKEEQLPVEIIGLAADGRKAADLIHKLSPDLVFLDIQMPSMDGFEVMENAPGPDYIIITAYESFEYAQKALRLLAKDILLKPLDDQQFVRSVNRAIGWQFTKSQPVNDVIEYVNRHYSEELGLRQLAQMLYVTPNHLAKLFKKNMNISLVTYIHQVRIANAVKLLRTKEYSIKSIAELTGYHNLNHFYKYFKIYTGTTPAQFLQEEQL